MKSLGFSIRKICPRLSSGPKYASDSFPWMQNSSDPVQELLGLTPDGDLSKYKPRPPLASIGLNPKLRLDVHSVGTDTPPYFVPKKPTLKQGYESPIRNLFFVIKFLIASLTNFNEQAGGLRKGTIKASHLRLS